jgi:hypothetical protein
MNYIISLFSDNLSKLTGNEVGIRGRPVYSDGIIGPNG